MWPSVSLGDTGNGLLSALAVLLALYHRDRTGIGQRVDTSIAYAHLLNASAAWVTPDGSVAGARPVVDRDHWVFVHSIASTKRDPGGCASP